MAKYKMIEKAGFGYRARIIRRTYRGEEQYKLITWGRRLWPRSDVFFRTIDSSVVTDIEIRLFQDKACIIYTVGKGIHEDRAYVTKHIDWFDV